MRTLIVFLLLCGSCFAVPVSRDYTCLQGHEQEATNKLQNYITSAVKNFFRDRRIEIDPSTLQVNVSLTTQTGMGTVPYVAFTGNAGGGFTGMAGGSATGSTAGGVTGNPAGLPGGAITGNPAAGLPGNAAGGASPQAGAGAAANAGGLGGTAAGSAAVGGVGGNVGAGLGGSAVAATVAAKDGTKFNVLFSSGSDNQDMGEYRIITTERGFTREGNPVGRHCHLRLFESGDMDATRTLLIINASSGHVLGRIPLPLRISLY